MAKINHIKLIKEFIKKERLSGETENDIYNHIVSEGYDPRTTMHIMTSIAHPSNIKKARWYKYILVVILFLDGAWRVLEASNPGERYAYMLVYIGFIFFVFKNSITVYYWILAAYIGLIFLIFGGIISVGAGAFTGQSGGFKEGIMMFVLSLPLLWTYKTLTVLFPYRGGADLGISKNGKYIFP